MNALESWQNIKALGIKIPDETWDKLHAEYEALWPDWVDENNLLEWFERDLALAAMRAREAWGDEECPEHKDMIATLGLILSRKRKNCPECQAELRAALEEEK